MNDELSRTNDQHVARPMNLAVRSADSRVGLQKIAEGVTDIVGFGVAAISHLRPDGELEMVAVAGSEDARQELLGTTIGLEEFQHELDAGDAWGLLRFVPEGRVPPNETIAGWIPDLPPTDDPNAWHAEDLLVALLIDDSGSLVGCLSVDMPADGMRPSPETIMLLQKYAVHAARAVSETMQRGELSEQVRLSRAVRAIARSASAHLSIDRVLDNSQAALIEGFNAYSTWMQMVDESGNTMEPVRMLGPEVQRPGLLQDMAGPSAVRLWHEQRVIGLTRETAPERMTPEQQEALAGYFRDAGLESIMFAPIGAGAQCMGYFVLCREEGAAGWTALELDAALDIGHDLGRALLNARLFQREQRLVDELTQLDGFRRRLISTISHELRTPLTSVVGYAELLESETTLSDSGHRAVTAINANAGRLSQIIEDLLLLSGISGPESGKASKPVDLGALIDESIDLLQLQIDNKGLVLEYDAPDEPVTVGGNKTDLGRVCTNLLSNATKYTPAGGRVRVSLTKDAGQVAVLSVSDDGIGISRSDQVFLFDEFFRSSDPLVGKNQGTGLGLSIVKRIVDTHAGTIEVRSEPGVGSTFTVRLPITA